MNLLQTKVTLMVTSDFLCWIPFIIMCFLHYLKVLDASPWYALFSVVIIPINSVINPLLYDTTGIITVMSKLWDAVTPTMEMNSFTVPECNGVSQAGESAVTQDRVRLGSPHMVRLKTLKKSVMFKNPNVEAIETSLTVTGNVA